MRDRGIIDKIVDKLFSMEKTTIYLLLIFALGFFLRFIAAINLTISADDMHFVTHAINFFSSGRLITYDQSAGLWFAFTSIIYKIFGLTQLASRMAALIFGSFSIFAIYLLSKEFFSKKTALIAAFLLAIAPFHIMYTTAEMDVMAMFFVLLSMLFFVKGTKSSSFTFYALSGLFIGLAVYTKVYPLLFIPSFLIYFAFTKRKAKEKIFSSKAFKLILVFLIFAFVFTIPALTHNYLLYKHNGFLDLQFTRTLGLGKNVSAEYYSWDVQFNAKNDWRGLFLGNSPNSGSKSPTLLVTTMFVFKGDPINFIMGILGLLLILFYKRDKINYLVFFIISILFVLPFLSSIIILPKHYMFLELLLIPAGAFLISEFAESIAKSYNKNIMKIIILALIAFTLVFLGIPNSSSTTHFYGKSHIAQMIEFKNLNIQENALIVGDSRLYRGRINWAFQGRAYLEGSEFITLANDNTLQGDSVLIEVYFFECVPDDCGWGYINKQPEFNASMESLVDFFQKNGQLVETIREPDETKSYYPLMEGRKTEIIKVYKARMEIKQAIVQYAMQPKMWFLYPIGYKPTSAIFDYYTPSGMVESILYGLARSIVIIALIISIMSLFYAPYLALKET